MRSTQEDRSGRSQTAFRNVRVPESLPHPGPNNNPVAVRRVPTVCRIDLASESPINQYGTIESVAILVQDGSAAGSLQIGRRALARVMRVGEALEVRVDNSVIVLE